MKARVLETCACCERLGYGFRHVVLSIDGQRSIDKVLCRSCATTVELVARKAAV